MDLGSARTRWAALGAAVAVTLGAGGIGVTHATNPSAATAFVPITPCRIVDTRPAPDTVGPRTAPLGPAEVYTVTARGTNGACTGIPTSATGLQLNVTAISATAGTFLTVWPAGAARPTTSNLNPQPGQPPTPNAVTTGLSSSGRFSIFNAVGFVNVIVDVVGYFTGHDHDDRYYTKSQVDAAIDAAIDAAVTESAAKTMWVQVSGSTAGSILRQSGGITLSYAGVGNPYDLRFPRSVRQCVASATLGGASAFDGLGVASGR